MLCIEFLTDKGETLIALLSDFSFEGFQEFEGRVEAYIEEGTWDAMQNDILTVLAGHATVNAVAPLPEKNWNAEWESSFNPVLIDDYCAIRASFHDKIDTCQYEIVIDPKMAFGTGHHETTELMIRQMRHLDFSNTSVLDLGCGTGILAILAALKGATTVVAIDNDPEAVQNAKDNAIINAVNIACHHAEVDSQPTSAFEVVLANINRNILLEIMPHMRRVLKPDGQLLLSGILREDKDVIVQSAQQENLVLRNEQGLGEWMCLEMSK